jgi:predicted nucleic acid-binding protein
VNPTVIADTGPLVALFDRGDQHHAWAHAGLSRIREPLLTVEAVVGEVLFLLRDLPRSRAAFLEFWSEGGLVLSTAANRELPSLIAILRKYADMDISLADAALVRLSELHAAASVWTLDRDFRVYRRLGRRVIPLFDWPR